MFTFNKQRREYIKFPVGLSRPAWAPISREFIKVPGRIGAHLISTETDIRAINIPVKIEAKGDVNLQKLKEDLAEWLVHDEVKELVFDDEPDRTYYAVVDGTLDLDEIVYYGKGVITFICPDGVKYGPKKEIKINPMEENKIYYAGTAPVIPEVEIIPKEKTTYAGYTNGKDSVMVGIPLDVESAPYDKIETVFNQFLSDSTGWVPATTMYNLEVTGEYRNSSGGLIPADYGVGNSWHGPSVVRVLNEELSDFELKVWTNIKNIYDGQIGRHEWHLLSADNEVLIRISIADWWRNKNEIIVSIDIGSVNGHKSFRFQKQEWSNWGGIVQLRKEENVYSIYIARSRIIPHEQVETARWIDTGGLVTKKLAKIQIGTFKFGVDKVPEMYFNQVHLRKINPDKEDMIPYIAESGDVVTIGDSGAIYKNGEQTGGLDVSSVFFPLKKGENKLTVLPPNSDVTVRFREVFK